MIDIYPELTLAFLHLACQVFYGSIINSFKIPILSQASISPVKKIPGRGKQLYITKNCNNPGQKSEKEILTSVFKFSGNG